MLLWNIVLFLTDYNTTNLLHLLRIKLNGLETI